MCLSPLDGVVLIDPDYFNKDGKSDRKGKAIFVYHHLIIIIHLLGGGWWGSFCSSAGRVPLR